MTNPARENVTSFPGAPIIEPFSLALENAIEQRVRWLWPGRLAEGKITVLDGDPGLGKSTLALDLAARISRGEALPDGPVPSKPRGTLILSAEDDAGDTIRPRLRVAGANLKRVFLFGLRDDQGNSHIPAIPEHLELIEHQIEATDAALVIFDPLVSYLSGDVKANHDQDVRRALSPLATMAGRTGAAILVLRHLNKASGTSAIYRGGGSIGIIGAARFGLLVGKENKEEHGDRRVIACVKCNIGPEPPSLAYTLESVDDTDVARIRWHGVVNVSANEMTEAPRSETDRAGLREAEAWLRDTLEAAPMMTKELQRLARETGIAWRTIEAAKFALGIKAERKGFGKEGQWFWRLPFTVGRNTPQTYSADLKTAEQREISHRPLRPQGDDGLWDEKE